MHLYPYRPTPSPVDRLESGGQTRLIVYGFGVGGTKLSGVV